MQFLDMQATYLELKNELDAAYFDFMNSGWYVLGEKAEEFEAAYAAFCGTQYCIGVSNGLDALHLSLVAGGIGPGDEVIVPANTYIATWLAVSQAGAKPVPVDAEWKTLNIDADRIEEAITEKTKAIMAVHLYGTPANMQKIAEIAEKYNLLIIEDNAQSQGAFYKEKRTGNLGHLGAVSFYPAKNIGAYGEAGAITTNSADYADKLRVLRNYGSRIKYQNEVKGFNRRIDALQAAFLSVKLKHLDEWNERRRKIAAIYMEGLANISCIRRPETKLEDSVWHQFIISIPNRDRWRERLAELGIPTMIHYPIPPHLSAAYADMGFGKGSFPVTEKMADSFLSLPIGPHMPQSDAEKVVECLINVAKTGL